MRPGVVRIGTSGWVYKHWKGTFYPPGVPQKKWLDHYVQFFDTVELNSTYYRMPSAEQFSRWRTKTPRDFLFVVKASKYITHVKRLANAEEETKIFFEGVRHLGKKRGPLLFQFPPSFRIDLERLDGYLRSIARRKARIAVEFRNDTWYVPELFSLLRKHGAGFVIPVLGRKEPPIEVTSDFAYVRFHGVSSWYAGLFGEDRLLPWAKRMNGWRKKGIDVFAYFNNDQRAYSVEDARILRGLIQSTDPVVTRSTSAP